MARTQLRPIIDAYQGIHIELASIPDDVTAFEDQINTAVREWRSAGYRLVWLTLGAEQASHIGIALAAGFIFHHCDPHSLTLTCKLVEDAFVPTFATHTVGIGGVVVSEDQKLLVVVERHDAERRPNYYKLPGGMADLGEHLETAVVRELREETGIETEFLSLCALRHYHDSRFGRSNLYFIGRLRPLTHEITIDETEIARALWMPLTEFFGHSDVSDFNKLVVRAALNPETWPSIELDGYAGGDRSKYEVFRPA